MCIRDRANVAGTLYMRARDGTHGVELWRSDGTGAGTTLVKDIYPGGSDSYPDTITDYLGDAFFSATDQTHGRELWRSDGTAGGTRLVKDIYPGFRGSTPRSRTRLTVLAHRLFFAATDPEHGRELWTSDGGSAGTNLVADINPGMPGSFPAGPTVLDGNLFFQARDLSLIHISEPTRPY